MARMRGRGIVAIWVLLACVCARHPSFVVADTDSNDGELMSGCEGGVGKSIIAAVRGLKFYFLDACFCI